MVGPVAVPRLSGSAGVTAAPFEYYLPGILS
jgi:hypothetical protein